MNETALNYGKNILLQKFGQNGISAEGIILKPLSIKTGQEKFKN